MQERWQDHVLRNTTSEEDEMIKRKELIEHVTCHTWTWQASENRSNAWLRDRLCASGEGKLEAQNTTDYWGNEVSVEGLVPKVSKAIEKSKQV